MKYFNDDMNNIAVIPARSGSKGLKNKNILELQGIPLLAYSVRAALDSRIFSKVIVSTDSNEYKEIAEKYGAEVPFLRSKINSTDGASSWDVVREVIDYYNQGNEVFDNVMLLQPTSPLRDAEDIVSAYKIFIDKQADAVISVTEVEHSPLWCNVLPSNNSMHNFLPASLVAKPRQKLEKYYRINGAIYLSKNINPYEAHLHGEKSYAFIMSKEHSIDIDDEYDFAVAEAFMRKRQASY